MSRILAIDPGDVKSAFVVYESGKIINHGIYANEDMLSIIKTSYHEHIAIEMIASYGMPVGKTVFETCLWIGRFIQVECEQWSNPPKEGWYTKVYRKNVKMHLCNSMRAKDSNIRQAIIDRYPATGDGKIPQIGTKAKPGPLYGVKKDIWAALAVAITFAETKK